MPDERITGNVADIESFGARLRRLRMARRISQSEIAGALGVSVPSISGWEKGRSQPKRSRVRALADILGVSTGELLGEEGGGYSTDRFAECRAQIARVAGTTPDKVRIVIEF